MRFKGLYDLVENEFQQPPVSFDRLRDLINAHHPGVGRVELYAVNFEEQNHQAHYRLVGYDRTSGYEEEFIVAQIRYCEGLDEHPRARRFALTKELMHVFDSEETKTDTREKFFDLLKEIQDRPLPEHRTGRCRAPSHLSVFLGQAKQLSALLAVVVFGSAIDVSGPASWSRTFASLDALEDQSLSHGHAGLQS